MRIPTLARVLVVALGVTAACDTPDREPSEQRRAYDLELISEVGAVDGENAFAGIRWVGPAPGAGILILEDDTYEVHVYGRDGGRLNFGGRGEGPGQVRSAHYAAWIPDGTYAVGETYPPRLHFFGADGRYLKTLDALSAGALPEGSAGAFGIWRIIRPDTAYLQVNPIPAPGAGESQAYVLRLVRGPDAEWSTERLRSWPNALASGPAGPPLLSPVSAWTVAPGGTLYFTPGGTYEIEARGTDGSPIHTIRRDMQGQAVSQEIQAAALTVIRASMAESLPAGAVDAMLEDVEFASTVPLIDRLLYDPGSGRLWAGRPDAASAAAQEPPGVWDVFDSTGTLTGSVALPERYRLLDVRDDRLYGVWTDDLDVEYARVYRLKDRE